MAKVITLDLARQLAEAAKTHGVELPESEYVHVSYENRTWDICEKSFFDDRRDWFDLWYNAYQTDELLEWIRKFGAREIRLWPLKNHYWGGCCPFSLPKDNQLSNTPRDTVCRLAIDLVEKGIIT